MGRQGPLSEVFFMQSGTFFYFPVTCFRNFHCILETGNFGENADPRSRARTARARKFCATSARARAVSSVKFLSRAQRACAGFFARIVGLEKWVFINKKNWRFQNCTFVSYYFVKLELGMWEIPRGTIGRFRSFLLVKELLSQTRESKQKLQVLGRLDTE